MSWSIETQQGRRRRPAHADINKLATVSLDVKANAGGGAGADPASFDIEGHIDATGLKKYIPGVELRLDHRRREDARRRRHRE